MPKFKITWWERNWWESTIEAPTKEDARIKYEDYDEQLYDKARETSDGFIERSADIDIEEVDADTHSID